MDHRLKIKHSWDKHQTRVQTGKEKKGMTVVCTPDPNYKTLNTWVGEPHVIVGIAFCSKNDSYSRKKGVATALSKQPVSVRIKDLPKYLANQAEDNGYYWSCYAQYWNGFALSLL